MTVLESQPVNLASNAGGCADPSLAIDATGTVYALFNGGSATPGAGTTSTRPPSLVTLTTSRDGGRTWSDPSKVWSVEDAPARSLASGSLDLAFDRPFLTIDPDTGALYASVSDDALVERVVMASHDHGRTWGPARAFDPNDQSVWADTISAAHGVLSVVYSVDPTSLTYVAAPGRAVTCTQACAVFATSSDDGATWARHVVPTSAVMSNALGTPAAPGLEVAADPSTAGRFAVLVPATAARSELWLTTDSGRSWQRRGTIDAKPGDAISRTWVAFGPTGALGVEWRDLHPDGSHDVYASVATGAGAAISAPLELTPGPAPPDVSKVPVGDDCACNLFLDRTTLYATWADARSGQRQVWFASYRFAPDARAMPGPRHPRRPRAVVPERGSLAATGASPLLGMVAGGLVIAALGASGCRRRPGVRRPTAG